jgi:hypothetical protein
VILDTKGNIFGGFTPMEWESRVWNGKNENESNLFKADPGLKSFLFTLKNPHNVPARRFGLKAEKKDQAIYCWPGFAPHFCDLGVFDKCNTSTDNLARGFGGSYINNTRLAGRTFLTGSEVFQVKEIEVFEIRNSTALP